MTKEGKPRFFTSFFIGLLESSHWALSFQPPTFENSENWKRKILLKFTVLLRIFWDARDEYIQNVESSEIKLKMINGKVILDYFITIRAKYRTTTFLNSLDVTVAPTASTLYETVFLAVLTMRTPPRFLAINNITFFVEQQQSHVIIRLSNSIRSSVIVLYFPSWNSL